MKSTPTQAGIYTCLFFTNCHCEYSSYSSYLPNGFIFTAAKHSKLRVVKGSCHFSPPLSPVMDESRYETLHRMSAFIFPKSPPNLALRLIAPFRHEPRPQPGFLRPVKYPAAPWTHVQPGTGTNWGESSVNKSLRDTVSCIVSFSHLHSHFSSAHNPNICQAMLAFQQSRVCICSVSVGSQPW